MSKRKWMTNDAVREHREEFANRQVSLEGLCRRTGLNASNIRRMLTGDTYEKAGGPLVDPEFFAEKGETFAEPLKCPPELDPACTDEVPGVVMHEVNRDPNSPLCGEELYPTAKKRPDLSKGYTPRHEMELAALRGRVDDLEVEADAQRKRSEAGWSASKVLIAQETEHRRTGERLQGHELGKLVFKLGARLDKAQVCRSILGWTCFILFCAVAGLAYWISQGGAA